MKTRKDSPVSGENIPQDEKQNYLRPKIMADFIGQDDICSNLKIFIKAAKQRDEALDHVLLAGPPGLGKTTLARIIACELGVSFRSTTGPVLDKVGDLAAILTALEDNDVLFIDEIHRINRTVEEFLYSAMEDFFLDIIIGEGVGARSVRIDLKSFTLIGATTRTGLLTTPLRDRFGIPIRLEYYSEKDLAKIILRAAKIMKISITDEGVRIIAKCSRATPRIAERLLRRLRDFAVVKNHNIIDKKLAENALKDMGVGKFGLDLLDQRYLQIIAENFQGGPVGIDNIAVTLNESRDMVEDVIEPYLIKIGFLNRSSRGRILTKQAIEHIGINLETKHQTEILFNNKTNK